MTIDYNVDFSEMAGIIGVVNGAAKILDDSRFMDRLITHAHKRTKPSFNNDAAAYAAATGTIRHMFEWGTAGINPGRTNRRMSPNDPMARLWEHTLTGTGKTKVAGFVFRPSLVPIPAPTVAKTGVPSSELAKLTGGPYLFTNKAAVIETARPVTIRPKDSDWLFVPFGPEGPRGASVRKGRNFIFTKGPVHTIPGKRLAGNFSKFWVAWWETEGASIMAEKMQTRIDYEMENLVDSIGRTMGARPSKVKSMQFNVQIAAAKRAAESMLMRESEME